MIARLHTYCGLLTFVNLMIFGIVGLAAGLQWNTWQSGWDVHDERIALAPGLSDRAIAERVCAVLGLSLATPVQSAAIQQGSQGRLLLDFWHVNGRHRVTLAREGGSMRVEMRRANLWKYLDTLHTTTAAFRTGDWRMRLWSWYNEFALWSLFGMLGSGTWMWLLRYPRGRLARSPDVAKAHKLRLVHLCSGILCLPFALFYAISGMTIAHRTWFPSGPLVRMHTHLPPGAAALAISTFSAALLLLGASGFLLWTRNARERKPGMAALLIGSTIAGALVVSMRLG